MLITATAAIEKKDSPINQVNMSFLLKINAEEFCNFIKEPSFIAINSIST